MTMAVSDIETQDLLKSIDAKLGSIVTIMAKNANVVENSQSAKIAQGFNNLQDPYAEQRKWVGKLCWFWDDEKEEKVCGILTTIDSDCGLSDMCPYWNGTTSNWFEHCEPVKPDDDIIYKGE